MLVNSLPIFKMPVHSLAALLLGGILFILAVIHVYWAFGGEVGSSVVPSQSGQVLFKPGPLATLLVAAALLTASLLSLIRAGLMPSFLPDWIPLTGVWFIGAVFALRAIGEGRYVGLFKQIKDTAFARMDTLIYSPLCFVLAGLAFTVALLSP